MPAKQSSLPRKTIKRLPKYDELALARVTSVADFDKYGRIEVMFLNYGQPSPVWVLGDLDRKPVSGDMVLVGFIEGRKDTPYLAGFQKNKSYSTNFVQVQKDTIRLQLPVYQIGTKNGIADTDTKGHLLDDTRRTQRAMVEMTPQQLLVQFPFNTSLQPAQILLKGDGSNTSTSGASASLTITLPIPGQANATITVTTSGVTIDHPGTIKHHGGSKGVARMGDTVSVSVNGTTYTGTITGASSKTLID